MFNGVRGNQSKISSDPKIIIVGAGIAGIAAGSSLVQKGFKNVILLEAENRIGGRINTVPFGGQFVDLGAHWIHGEVGNVVHEIGRQRGLIQHSGDFQRMQFVTDDGQEIPSNVGQQLYEYSSNQLQNTEALKNANGSVQHYLLSRCLPEARKYIADKNLLDGYAKWLCKFESVEEGCDDLTQVPSSGLAQYKYCPGDSDICWSNGGYKNIIDILLNEHPSSVKSQNPLKRKIILNADVIEISWGGPSGFVKCRDGRVFKADHIIVTISLGVLKEQHSQLFTPRLPYSKIRAINALEFGTVNKIYLKFATRWWPENCGGFSLIRTNKATCAKEEYEWARDLLGFYTESTSPLVLGGWLVGDSARRMENYTDNEILKACHRILVKFVGKKYYIPQPESIIRSKWHSNSHFRGSYSHRSKKSEHLGESSNALAKSIQNLHGKEILHFAGEATHSCYFSTVHGALESGLREAEQICKKYSNKIV